MPKYQIWQVGKRKQVIMERWEEAISSPASAHMCGRMQREDRNNPSMCWVTALRSQKWCQYVNWACVDGTSVHQVVKKAFITQTQPYQGGAGRFSGWRAAAIAGPFSPTCFIFSAFISLQLSVGDFWASGDGIVVPNTLYIWSQVQCFWLHQ